MAKWMDGGVELHGTHLCECCSVYYGLGIRHGTQAGYGPSQAGAL